MDLSKQKEHTDMPNEELQEGVTFGDLLPTETDGPEPTPEPAKEETPPATDGGTPEPETLGVLKEKEEAPEEGKPDLSLDPELEKHPILKAKWEAYKAQKEKGIDKFITDTNEKLKDAEQFKTDYEPLVDFYQEFNNPETVDAAFGKMCAALSKTYGRPFGAAAPASTAAAPQTEGGSKYGFEFESEDRILETAVKVVEDKIGKLLDERLGPIAKKFETEEQTTAMRAKVTESLPALKSTFEVTADPWVTPEKVEAAVREFPGLPVDKAFRAMYADEIARYAVKHSGGQQKVRNLPLGEGGGKARSELKAESTFGDILAAEATLT